MELLAKKQTDVCLEDSCILACCESHEEGRYALVAQLQDMNNRIPKSERMIIWINNQ